MNKNYKITLSKEVARECAWGVLAKIQFLNNVFNKMQGEN